MSIAQEQALTDLLVEGGARFELLPHRHTETARAEARALGLELDCFDAADRAERREAPPRAALPARIRLADYPQLRSLAWQRAADDQLSPREALELYERGWRHVDAARMAPNERALVEVLAATLDGRTARDSRRALSRPFGK